MLTPYQGNNFEFFKAKFANVTFLKIHAFFRIIIDAKTYDNDWKGDAEASSNNMDLNRIEHFLMSRSTCKFNNETAKT